jgi:IrrE N-terminal-like domain
MSDHGRKPIRWANDLNTILAAAVGDERFPVPVERLATEYSRMRFPAAPIVDIKGGSLGSFEGALYPVHDGKGWAIIYNTDVSAGRRRFTIAHEFGHYLMHRQLLPKGIECSEEAVTFRDGAALEQEADTFAAYLLMPLDDFRKRLPPDVVPTLDDVSELAGHYGVSLISSIIRWLEYTHRRSMLVVSRDEFVLWSRSSGPAFKTGRFIRSRNVPPVPVPAISLVGRREFADIAREGILHPAGVWFEEECTEMTLHADKYDQAVTILLFGRAAPRGDFSDETSEPDTLDQFSSRDRTRFDD